MVAARANWLALQLREPAVEHAHCTTIIREPWNKGKLVGQKAPLKLKEIWAIRVRLQLAGRHRDLALFNLAIDSKLRAATWLSCVSETSATEAPSHPGRLCCSRKPNGRYSSRLLSQPGRLWEPGSVMQD